jgi:hypothetical protein
METGFDRLGIHWQEVSRFVNFSETRQRRERLFPTPVRLGPSDIVGGRALPATL